MNYVIIAFLLLLAIGVSFFLLYNKYPLLTIYKSKNAIESTLDAIADPIAVIDSHHNVLRANKAYASITGFPFSEVIGTKCYFLLRNRDTPCIDCRMQEALDQNKPQIIDHSPHPDGTGSLSIRQSPFDLFDKNKTSTVIEHIRDITYLELMQQALEKKNQELAVTMHGLESAQQKINHELKLARQIQQGLFQTKAPIFEGIKVNLIYHPIEDVGGDLYDFTNFENKKFSVFIADASGHGLSSAFIATITKMSLINRITNTATPSEQLYHLNNDLSNTIHSGHYITCILGVFDIETKVLTYTRAGHPPAIVMKKNGSVHILDNDGIFVGIIKNTKFTNSTYNFDQGDRFLFFTDGIYEVATRLGKHLEKTFGYEWFIDMITKAGYLPFEQVIPHLQNELSVYSYEDDYTLIVIEIT